MTLKEKSAKIKRRLMMAAVIELWKMMKTWSEENVG